MAMRKGSKLEDYFLHGGEYVRRTPHTFKQLCRLENLCLAIEQNRCVGLPLPHDTLCHFLKTWRSHATKKRSQDELWHSNGGNTALVTKAVNLGAELGLIVIVHNHPRKAIVLSDWRAMFARANQLESWT